MTEEQRKSLSKFETRVRQLMLLCEDLKKDNQLLTKELEANRRALLDAERQIQEASAKFESLKLAKMLSFERTDVQTAQRRLSGLVREIDKCIELMKN
ncbi:MAG: hypothetical protein PHQ26_00540 [Bacteroidales bacterium]|jgi:chromosome segregation ATPase|nr:hypothetical protein [Bacteroidales bacterium]MDD3166008.1 hypothetical protein [Bacteroidales bacterium]MDD4769951.1 hypothetical protein [Bacteroidales bacterium]HKL91891.1 hypothetical protein [Bacteroidales bacterium]